MSNETGIVASSSPVTTPGAGGGEPPTTTPIAANNAQQQFFAADQQIKYNADETTDSDTPSHNSITRDEKSDFSGITTLSPDQGTRTTRLDRKESYKAQRKSYAKEKKRVERELLSTFKDQSIIVLADWLKVRGTLKSWTKLWCVLKPGLLLLYRSPKAKSSHWIGTIILSTCELIERPSKKDGFCFKLFHPMDQSIWASRGPDGEAIGAVVQPLPTSHCIFRAPNNPAGKCWMDALELALRCSSLLLRTMSSAHTPNVSMGPSSGNNRLSSTSDSGSTGDKTIGLLHMQTPNESDLEREVLQRMRECASDYELDFGDDDDDDDDSIRKAHNDSKGDESDYSEDAAFGDHDKSSTSSGKDQKSPAEDKIPVMTKYVPDPSGEVFGTDQTEEISDENKSIVWFLVKQVRPGMDLSKVVLPTFILEPRSFLEKISDYYYHADLLSEAVRDEEPFSRMKSIVKWYLSGFYKKPKGLKKPYNPILGETYRCYWEHPNGSKTFFIAEQVSHHPPISASYVANRQDGFTLSACILAKSKFYGNSTSAILDGVATLSLLPRGEDYLMTMPYAHCKGILMGTMTMELGGKVTIECSKTGYATEIEFKLRPFLGGGEFTNAVSGKIKLGKETLVTLDGHWDNKVVMKDKRTGSEEVLWTVTDDMRAARLKRFTVPMEDQTEFESERLWKKVSEAIDKDDQTAATEEKFTLEEAQRAAARDRKTKCYDHVPRFFELDAADEQYVYKHSDLRPWDPLNDLYQYERDYIVCTRTKHKTPLIRTQSIISVSEAANVVGQGGGSTGNSIKRPRRAVSSGIKNSPKLVKNSSNEIEDDLSKLASHRSSENRMVSDERLQLALRPLEDQQRQVSERLAKMQHTLDVMAYSQRERDANSNINRDMVLLVILVVMIQAVLNWILTTRAQAASGIPPPLSQDPSE